VNVPEKKSITISNNSSDFILLRLDSSVPEDRNRTKFETQLLKTTMTMDKAQETVTKC
jgi:hypothetical protein